MAEMKKGMLARAAAQDEPMPADAELGMEGDEDVEADPDDPRLERAMRMARESLYRNGAAEELAMALQQAPSVAEGIAEAAYNMLQMVDDMTRNAVPDELFMLLGMQLLGEVADIATAAGAQPQPRDIAQAMQQLMLRVVEDAGGDTSQLREAMASIPPDALDAVAQEGA